MIKDKISSQEIIDLVASKASVSKRAAEEFLKVMIASIEDALLSGEVVKIKNFGTFKLQWNEPRKSVNIQTGEQILLSGYHKVTFVPDVVLKGKVNEPFSHLEPIQLDNNENNDDFLDNSEEALDPLRIFTEQATEIKNLISEIQALTPNAKLSIVDDFSTSDLEESVKIEPLIIDEEFIIDEEIEVENKFIIKRNVELDDVSIDENNVVESSNKPQDTFVKDVVSVESDENKTEEEQKSSEIVELEPKSQLESFSKPLSTEQEISQPIEESDDEFIFSRFPDKVKSLSIKRRRRYRILLIIFLVVGSGVGLYLFSPPATTLGNTLINKSNNLFIYYRENISMTEMFNKVSKFVSPAPQVTAIPKIIVVPKDTFALDSILPVDSLQIMFDNPRVYNEFIASERIMKGSRLARMAQRYFGTSDFWVYIYEANKDKIQHPDTIAFGTLIRIPKLDPRLIDATNPRCISKAKELHDLYVK